MIKVVVAYIKTGYNSN